MCDKYKTAPTKALIAKLNPIIIGWANYFSTIISKEIFSKLDMLLWKSLWRWANRRHPNKPAKWVKKSITLTAKKPEIGYLTAANIYYACTQMFLLYGTLR
ncbi:MAG: hypothetical protein MGG11_00615 [Trichodesmium sp. MAG_R03]|nr:hypothetical protein [Trichodesmium sp. MAG_R03]